MVRKLNCECAERYAADIDSQYLFTTLRSFFEVEVAKGIFEEIHVDLPYFVGHSELQTLEWFADKWYKCTICGCLWEFCYPEFPAHGFVRKFPDGIYKNEEW